MISQRSAGRASVVSIADHDNHCSTTALHDLLVHTTTAETALSSSHPPSPALHAAQSIPAAKTQAHNPPSLQATHAYGADPCETQSAKLPRTLPRLRAKSLQRSRRAAPGGDRRTGIARGSSGRISLASAHSRLQMPMGRRDYLHGPYQTSRTRMSSRKAVRSGYQMAYMYPDPELQKG